jgi:hypothetical protein
MATALLAVSFNSVFAQNTPVETAQAWVTDTIFKTPESVYYDTKRDILYVANINKIGKETKDGDGFISKLKLDGTIENLKWVTGLNDPKGMAVVGNILYVSDLTQLVEIDIPSGKIKKRHDVEGAQFLNDVASNEEGDVLITDSHSNRVYKLNKGTFLIWLEGSELDKPNGLFMEKDEVLVASMNKGTTKRVNHKTKEEKIVVTEIPSTDGIAADGKGNYFFSNWNGEVYYVNSKGDKWKIVDTKDQKIGAADLTFAPKYALLLVPTFFGNRVYAYKITWK